MRSLVQSPAWSRVEHWATFLRHTVRRQGTLSRFLVSRRSIGVLKIIHALVDKSRLMPVLWSVISSLYAPRSRMGRIAAARGALFMPSVLSREQQVAEKSYGELLYTSSSSSGIIIIITFLIACPSPPHHASNPVL